MRTTSLFHWALAAGIAAVCCTSAHAQPMPVVERGLLPGDLAIAPESNSQQDHAVAKGGEQYLAVWSDYRGQSAGGGTNQSNGDIFGIRLDSNGNPIDAMPFLIGGGMGLQRYPLVAWNGDAWLVLYISQDVVGGYFEYQMRAVRVSASGQVLDTTPILFPPTQFTPSTIGLQVAGHSGQWLVTRCIYHDTGYGTYLAGQRIDGNGQLLDTVPVMLNDWIYGQTKTITANGEYLVAGPDWSTSAIKARRIGLDGQPIGSSFAVPSLNLAGNGSEYYVVWIADFVNLVGSRMTPNGTLLTPAGTQIVANYSQYNQTALAHDGTNWWLEWGAADQLRTVRIDANGVVLDPNGGVLLPITIGGNINTAYGVALAPRTGGGVHVFWYDLRVALGYDSNVFALPVSAANVPGTERCVSTGTRTQRTPDLAGGPGGQNAVVFVSEAANDDRVLVHFLDANGIAITNEPIEVSSGPTIGKAGIAWNGSIYLVTWDAGASGLSPTQIKARRMNADGTFVDAAPFDVMPGFSPDVDALGEDFLIATARYDTNPQFIYTWMRIVDGPTGAFQNAATLIGGFYVSVGPRVRNDGTRWIVTYHSHWSHDASQSDAIYNFVSADGSFTPASNPATTSGGSGTPDVAFSGDKYLFVWRNNSLSNANNYIAGRIMNANGTFATGNFTIAEAPGRQLRPVVGWDGTNFVVAWDDQRNQSAFFDERTDIYGARVSESGAVLDPSAFPIYAGPQGDATAALLSRPDGVTLVASTRFQTTAPYDSYRIGLTLLGTATTVDVPDVAGARPARLDQNFPNPFHPSTTIRFGLRQPENVTITVHDASGRRVARVASGQYPAGEFSAEWDGRDDAGRAVAPGTFFLRMEAGGFRDTRKMTLLR
ncbi:MAG: FlgD immunoglobulin-like domain containing protein [bacterium]